jgi:hypothetical protein
LADKKLDSLVENVRTLYLNAKKEWNTADTRGKTCMEFMLNKQWSDEEVGRFAKHGLPPIVYNLILPRINNLRGTEELNRRSVVFKAFYSNQRDMANILSGGFNHRWNVQRAEDELSKCFADGLIMPKPGLFKVSVLPDEAGFYDYHYRHLNPYSAVFDPTHTDYRLRDCDYVIQESWVSLEEMIDTYGDTMGKIEGYNKKWWEKLSENLQETVGDMFGESDPNAAFFDKKSNKYKVLEMQTRINKKQQLFINRETGEYFVLDNPEREEVPEGLEYISDTKSKRIHITTISAYHNATLFDGDNWLQTDMYDIIPYYSIDLSNAKSQEPSSLVWAMLDPQRNLNKRQIQKTGYIDRAMVSPIVFSAEDRDAKEDYDENGNLPGYSMIVRNLKFPPHRMAPAQMNGDVWNDLADSRNNLNDISGVNETARGQSEHANESARMFQMKLQRVGATINPYLKTLSKTRLMIAEYYLQTCAQVYPEINRVILTVNHQKQTSVAVLNELNGEEIKNNISTFAGEVVLDEGDYSISKLQENMQAKLAYAQIMPPELVNWRWVLKDSDLPDIEEQIEYMEQVLGIQSEQNDLNTAMELDNYANQQAMQKEQLEISRNSTAKNKGK